MFDIVSSDPQPYTVLEQCKVSPSQSKKKSSKCSKGRAARLAKKDIPYCSLDYFLVQSDENFLKMGGGGGEGEVLFFINEKFRL